MAHIVTNADGSFRAAYKDLGPDSLEAVETDAKKRGFSVAVVSMAELRDAMSKQDAIAAEKEAAALAELVLEEAPVEEVDTKVRGQK